MKAMTGTILLATAVAAATPFIPSAVAAQDQGCKSAIKAVEQRLQQAKQRDDWNRVQVQLYIAEQFLAEGQPKSCLGAVREARAILKKKTPPTDAAASGATRTAGQPGQEATQKDKDTDPGGANISGMDTEGWGTHEAKSGAFAPERAGDTAAASREQAGPSRVPARDIIGKTVRIPTGEPIGKIAGVTEKSPGPQRVVIATGEAKIAVAPSALRYDRTNDVVVVDITEAELEDALAASGGETAAETGTGTATQKE